MEEPRFAEGQPQHHLHLARASNSLVYASFYMSHALFEYRSFQLISQQLCQAYLDVTSVLRGLDMSRYIGWLQHHPMSARDYWKAHLSGTRPCFILVLNSTESNLLDRTSPSFIDVSINQPLLLRAFCCQHGVTVANLVQLAWGIALQQCAGLQSVTFGCAQYKIGNVEGDETMLVPLLTNIICRTRSRTPRRSNAIPAITLLKRNLYKSWHETDLAVCHERPLCS